MVAVPDKKSVKSKKNQVEEMFDDISSRYDLLNHLLSANIDKIWRKRVINRLSKYAVKNILDIATGTADFAIAASKIKDSVVTGIDISEGMLEIGRQKILKAGLDNRVLLIKADSENLPFDDNSFDGAIVGFGVRNFENLKIGLSEIYRVLKPGAVFFVLEFSKPKKTPVKQFYHFYFTRILPLIGKMVSKHNNAYTYLPESVDEFPDGEDFLSILAEIGFENNKCFPQTFGIASVYEAHKQKNNVEIQ